MIGNKIREIRIKQNLSMKNLATMCGTSSSYISDLENGYIKKPSADKLLKIANALGVTLESILYSENSLINKLAKRTGDHVVDDIYPLIEYINKSRFNDKYDIKALFSNSDLIDLASLIDDVVSNRLKSVVQKNQRNKTINFNDNCK